MFCATCCGTSDPPPEVLDVEPQPAFQESPPRHPEQMTKQPEETAPPVNTIVKEESPDVLPAPVQEEPNEAVRVEDAPAKSSEFDITLTKGQGDVVGLDVDWGDLSKLRITKVKDGLVLKWNVANPSQQIKAGDVITQINGCTGDVKALLDVVKSAQSITMTIIPS